MVHQTGDLPCILHFLFIFVVVGFCFASVRVHVVFEWEVFVWELLGCRVCLVWAKVKPTKNLASQILSNVLVALVWPMSAKRCTRVGKVAWACKILNCLKIPVVHIWTNLYMIFLWGYLWAPKDSKQKYHYLILFFRKLDALSDGCFSIVCRILMFVCSNWIHPIDSHLSRTCHYHCRQIITGEVLAATIHPQTSFFLCLCAPDL